MDGGIQTQRQFFTRIMLPVVAFALAAILFAMLGLFSLTWQSDRLSMEREIRTTQLALDRSIQELARQQELLVVGDEPILRLRAPEPDWRWFDENVGGRLYESFRHDRVYILDSRDRPVYAMIGGVRVDPASFAAMEPYVERMVAVVRGRIREPNHRHDRNPGQARPSDGSVLTTERAVHESHLLSIGGEPAAASVMLMVPLSARVPQAKGAEPIAISIRYLRTDFARPLSMARLLEGARFSPSGEVRPPERAIILKSDHGEAIGHFIWTPERPGSQIFAVLGPVIAIVLLALLVLLGWLARSLHRSFSHLRREVVVREEAERRAEALARHDSLTGLPNRRVFVEALGRPGTPLPSGALILADVDSMRGLNEAYGYAAADELLVRLAGRLKALAGESGLVARTGGDQFSLFLPAAEEEPEMASMLEGVAAALKEPLAVGGVTIPATVTLGAAFYPADSATPAELINAAEAALGRGKREARGGCTYYDAQTDASGRQGGNVTELDHPSRELQRFEVAEITDTVLRSAFRSAAEWPAGTALCLSVPSAPLRDPWFAARLLAVLEASGLPTGRLIVEVPEAALAGAHPSCADNLAELQASGIRLSVRDSGNRLNPGRWRAVEIDQVRIDTLGDALSAPAQQPASGRKVA